MLYIDCTDTITRGYATGIQRVVRKVIGELLTHHPDRACAVMAVDDLFYPLHEDGRRALARPSQNTVSTDSKAQKFAKRLLGLYSPAYLYMQRHAYRAEARRARDRFADTTPCAIGPGDSLLLLDSFWNGPGTLAAAHHARAAGASIIGYIHDLIPITHPHVMPRWQRVATAYAVRKVAEMASAIVTTSEHCSSTVRAFLGKQASGLPIVHNYHGMDFSLEKRTGTQGSGLMKRLRAEERQSYVMVGTIEPRKGHDVVLSAFERRWAAGSDAALIFVGRIGWAESDFVRKLQMHPEGGRRLFVLNEADDGDLAAILRGADAAIVASIVEGFGLPVIEALGAGLPLIASDIPVFREIAERHALFFSARDPAGLADTIGRFEADGIRPPADFTWPNWQQSAERLLLQVEALSA